MKYTHTEHVNIKVNPESGIYYYVKGKLERSLHTTEYAKAVERKDFLEDEIHSSGSTAVRRTVGSLYPDYLAHRKLQNQGKLKKHGKFSDGSLYEIECVFDNHLLPYFGRMKLSKVTTPAWAKYCDRALVKDLANHRKVFYGFWKWCKRKGYRKDIPDISEIPHHVRRRRRIVKPHELVRIFEHARGGLLVFLSLALYNGMRRKEIMTLKWVSVNLDERFVVIEREANKRQRTRSIPINETVVSVLLAWQASTAKSPWVFANAKNARKHGSMSGLKTAWRTCLKRAKLSNITWHDLRATYETHNHKRTDFTDTQREKFADATMEVQKGIYVDMDHDDLRGLENAVQVPGLELVIARGIGKSTGASV